MNHHSISRRNNREYTSEQILNLLKFPVPKSLTTINHSYHLQNHLSPKLSNKDSAEGIFCYQKSFDTICPRTTKALLEPSSNYFKHSIQKQDHLDPYKRLSFKESISRPIRKRKKTLQFNEQRVNLSSTHLSVPKLSQSIIVDTLSAKAKHSEEEMSRKNSLKTYLSTQSSKTQEKLIETPRLSKQSFRMIKFLGKGKFGQVHLVMHKETGFICAMKVMNKKVIKQEKMENPIMKEIKVQSSLNCGNIVQLYGFFDDEQNIYILLEYAIDGCLFSLLKNQNRLQEPQISELIREIAQGIEYTHKMGFIHRDLKPENIVLNFNVPKICDFGWATECKNFDLCKSYCGTPLYLPPEMIRKEYYGQSVDVWTIGLLTYELLVGKVAFNIWTQKDLQSVLYLSPIIPLYVDRSSQCENFIDKCLEKDSYKRISISQALRHPFLNSNNSTSEQNEHNFIGDDLKVARKILQFEIELN